MYRRVKDPQTTTVSKLLFSTWRECQEVKDMWADLGIVLHVFVVDGMIWPVTPVLDKIWPFCRCWSSVIRKYECVYVKRLGKNMNNCNYQLKQKHVAGYMKWEILSGCLKKWFSFKNFKPTFLGSIVAPPLCWKWDIQSDRWSYFEWPSKDD